MTGNSPWKAQDNVEPIQADTIGAIANIGSYATISGCGQTYSISDMVVTIASGSVLHNSTVTTVAGNTVTLVSDPTNPRWTYQYVNSSGVAAIVSGTPAASPSVPDFGANVTGSLTYVQAGLTIAGNATYQLDKRVMTLAITSLTGITQKYKSTTQTVSASTSLVDVSAASGNFAFAIAANEVWQVEYIIPLTFTGTGGAKFQITGPSAPTAVTINALVPFYSATLSSAVPRALATVTAFSTNIAAADAAAAAGESSYSSTVAGAVIRITATIANGSNAGTVTLQMAQNTANGTVVAGVGSFMRAMKVA